MHLLLDSTVWADGVEPQFIAMSKSGNYYVLQVDKLKKFNVSFLAGKVSGWDEKAGYKGKYGQTVDIKDITANACYQITGFDAAKKDQLCTVQALDCLTGDELTALEDAKVLQTAKKVITADGQLQLIMADGTVFNVLGATIK